MPPLFLPLTYLQSCSSYILDHHLGGDVQTGHGNGVRFLHEEITICDHWVWSF
jgi:hypothetical protein